MGEMSWVEVIYSLLIPSRLSSGLFWSEVILIADVVRNDTIIIEVINVKIIDLG